jgi:hypothetical protein
MNKSIRQDKPANWIPRDGLLARAVRLFRKEGHSQSRIGRELRLNRRTVSRLCAGETNGELFAELKAARAGKTVENCQQSIANDGENGLSSERIQVPTFQRVRPLPFLWRKRRAL